jgi:glycosyltransferase involved in cell wall biosynthesis
MKNNLGINISGYINKQFGLGEGVRANIRAIKTTNIKFVLNNFDLDISDTIESMNSDELNLVKENPYNINLIQVNFDKIQQFLNEIDIDYIKGKYNIAFWAWELENFPVEYCKFIEFFDEIWVPSNFCAEAISIKTSKPVIKIPHSIEIKSLGYYRSDFNLPENKFIFLTMFDYNSSLKRKNPIATIESFLKSFKNNNDVLLVIKTSISKKHQSEKELITKFIVENSNIIILEEIYNSSKLFSLINICDAFISLHRSEGFGLTMAEAMYLEKPVIATGYSSNTEFMNNNNSFLVNYSLIDLKNDYSNKNNENRWAEPSINHASELMTLIYNNKELRTQKGKRAKIDIQTENSPEKIGKRINERINLIHKIFEANQSNLDKNNPEIKVLKIENQLLNEKLIAIKKVKYIQLKIWFKNLMNKIKNKDRKYFWE